MGMLNARQARLQHEITIDIGDGVEVRARKEDMTLLVFDGRVPMPLLTAVQRMIDMPHKSDIERIASLGSEHGRDLIRILREHVASVLIEPRCSADATDDPDVLPASYFSMPQLMTIWTATAVVPMVTNADAARFRANRSADDDSPAPNGEVVPPAPEPVVAPESEREVVTR